MLVSSPRTWGCFSTTLIRPMNQIVFPTHVGVFLDENTLTGFSKSLPHARGGVSNMRFCFRPVGESSPRTWGCFHVSLFRILDQVVFPTHVGVFLVYIRELAVERRLPHARGGVSKKPVPAPTNRGSSPRTWGCFWCRRRWSEFDLVFPTHVGVFLDR